MSHFINADGLPVSLEADLENCEHYTVYSIFDSGSTWSSRTYAPYAFKDEILPLILIFMYAKEKLLEPTNKLFEFFEGNGIFVDTFTKRKRTLKHLDKITVKSRLKTRVYVVHLDEIPKLRVKTILQSYLFNYRESHHRYEFTTGQVIDLVDDILK